jgi:hypothetical protein
MSKYYVELDTEQMLRNYMSAMTDMLLDCEGEVSAKSLAQDMDNLATENVAGIRQMFSSGVTMFLVPNFDLLEDSDEQEIRIVSRRTGNLLTVLVNKEIDY